MKNRVILEQLITLTSYRERERERERGREREKEEGRNQERHRVRATKRKNVGESGGDRLPQGNLIKHKCCRPILLEGKTIHSS